MCDNYNSHPVTRSYPLKWSCEAKGGFLFQSYVVYKMFVEVSNYLGSNQSKAVVVKANMMNPLLSMFYSILYTFESTKPQNILSVNCVLAPVEVHCTNFFS